MERSARPWGSGISKGEDGAASTITPRCASRPMDSDLRARDDSPLKSSSHHRNLPYAKTISPEDAPLRPERHVPNSIATMRRTLVVALVATYRGAHAALLQSLQQASKLVTQ